MAVEVNHRKVAIIGAGFVGSATAFALSQSGLFSEMVLIDADHDKAEGEAMDISHGAPFNKPMKIYAGNYDQANHYNSFIEKISQSRKIENKDNKIIQKE